MSNKPASIEPGMYEGIRVTQGWNPIVNTLKPLDFFMTCGQDLFSVGIRIITSNLSNDRHAEYNHSGIFPDGSACTLEANWILGSNNFFERYEGCNVLIARYNKMNASKVKIALDATNKHIGQWYPTRRIFLHLINMAHIFHWSESLVCSEYVAKVLYKAGARHGKYHGTTPDALADEAEYQLNKERTGPRYDIIYKDKLKSLYYKYCNKCKTFWLMPSTPLLPCPSCNQQFTAPLTSPNAVLNQKAHEYNELKRKYVLENNK